jgi:hypothetical protein
MCGLWILRTQRFISMRNRIKTTNAQFRSVYTAYINQYSLLQSLRIKLGSRNYVIHYRKSVIAYPCRLRWNSGGAGKVVGQKFDRDVGTPVLQDSHSPPRQMPSISLFFAPALARTNLRQKPLRTIK